MRISKNRVHVVFLVCMIPSRWYFWIQQQLYDEDERKKRELKSQIDVAADRGSFFFVSENQKFQVEKNVQYNDAHFVMRRTSTSWEKRYFSWKSRFIIVYCFIRPLFDPFLSINIINLLGKKNLNVCLRIENFTEIQLWILWPDSEGFVEYSSRLTCI